jgi:purine-binding chemotaxis protein CheW
MHETMLLCTFRVATLEFGVEVMKVQEVLRAQAMTVVPLAPDAVSGLVNLRGQIVTAIDMRRRLGLADRDPGEAAMNVIVRTEDGAVSLLVDDIGDVIEADPEATEPVPATVAPALRALITGVQRTAHSLLLVLDPEAAADLSALPT